MSMERGDVVVAIDPFKDDEEAGRPFLVLNRAKTPFHGEQFTASSSSRVRLQPERGIQVESHSQTTTG
jgi:mRNA interferase MazF